MKIKYLLLVLTMLVAVNSYAAPDISAQNKPYQLATELSELLVNEMAQLPQGNNRKTKIEEFIEQQLLPYFDSKYAALFVLGKQVRKLDKLQVNAFVSAFQGHLITTYANALNRFGNQKIQLQAQKKTSADAKKVAIKALVTEVGKPDIKLTFKLRKNSKTGQWRVYDFVVEGISLLHTKRTEFAAQFRKQGFDTTLLALAE